MIAALRANAFAVAALAALVAVAGAYIKGRADGRAVVAEAWQAERIAAAAAIQMQTERARLVEQQASQSIARQQERTNANLQDIDRRHRAALERVRSSAGASGRDLPRCAAPSAPADNAGIVFGTDGAVAVPDTLNADREWLLTLAAEADQVRVALEACRAWADTVQGMTREN